MLTEKAHAEFDVFVGELALRMKGLLVMRECVFCPAVDKETRASRGEMRFPEKRTGATGELALAPFLHVGREGLWPLCVPGK